MAFLAVVAAAVASAVSLSGCGSDDSSSCPAACPSNTSKRVTFASGFTTNTGFANQSQCCDICFSGPQFPKSKNGSYDWDFITMDALFVPQFCHGLAEGHDFTLTYLNGSTCTSAKAQAGFQIHGLWPNYDEGFPSCCSFPPTLTSEEAEAWDFLPEMQANWASPVVGDSCDVCFNWNHEWQKHGGCFAAKPKDYLEAGLQLFAQVQMVLEAVTKAFLSQPKSIMNSSTLQEIWDAGAKAAGLNSTKVHASCDVRGSNASALDGQTVKYFAEVQWCYRRRSNVSYGVPLTAWDLEIIDCPPSRYSCDVFAIRESALPLLTDI